MVAKQVSGRRFGRSLVPANAEATDSAIGMMAESGSFIKSTELRSGGAVEPKEWPTGSSGLCNGMLQQAVANARAGGRTANNEPVQVESFAG